MKIKSLQLKNFKRFTDLTLQDIPETAKLVLLIGSNGSGKSCVFDAFEAINKQLKNDDKSFSFLDDRNQNYYNKVKQNDFEIRFKANNSDKEQYVSNNSGQLVFTGNSLIGRSAVRYLPKLTKTVLGTTLNIKGDTDRPLYYNEIDRRFENDIDLIMEDIIKRVFIDFNKNGNKNQIDEIFVFRQRINDALKNIFSTATTNSLTLIDILPPSDGNPIQINFNKGKSTIHYDLLSSGEKEIINLLFNLYTRTKVFTDTIYFIDEMDTHLNTSLQYSLLKEITENWIPENCQLWTASHSLGFIDYANDYKNASIIDLDDLDFDKPQILKPTPKNDFEVFEIAVGKTFIDKQVQGRTLIFSENTDTPLYNDLSLGNILFCVGKDKMDVFQKAKIYTHLGLIDRDYLTDIEIIELKATYPFLKILPYYSIENLLFHPDNLLEYYSKIEKLFEKEAYINQIIAIKNIQKDYIAFGIALARNGYPFYKENGREKELKQFKQNNESILEVLRSDDFETFYKVFPAKDYGKELPQRQNISKSDLSKTLWFKSQIERSIG